MPLIFKTSDGNILKNEEKKPDKGIAGESEDKAIQKQLLNLFSNGYLSARLDSTKADADTRVAWINPGPQFKWAKLSKGNVEEQLLSSAGFREKIFFNEPLNFKEVERLGKNLLAWCENNGYPFATFKLDSLKLLESNALQAALNLEKNKKITIDTIIVQGDARISPAYLYNYIGIKPGDAYNEALFLKVSARIKELPFLTELKPHEMIFSEGDSKLVFHLAQKKANRVDGILGILPDDAAPGKVLLTGDLQIRLLNSLGSGELIDLNWRKLQNETQDLRTQLVYPFLFSSPFGLDLRFGLYKRDTTFINLNPYLGLQYMLTGGNYFKVFLNQKSSRILSTKGLEFINQLPPYADITTTLYGIGCKFEQLDYRLNPRKGYRLIANGAVGNRLIQKHPKISEIAYEGLELKSVQYDVNFLLDYFIPLTTRSTIKLANNSALLFSPNTFENELYRIGGLYTLRGFDEEAIFASAYSIFTIEARYLLEQNSYAHLFWNGAWYENDAHNKRISDLPWGFGAGMSFETKAGIFSLSYALGKQFDNPFQLRTGKIHFGIISFL
jgi:outer membrane protein assembly factor BamA